MEKLKFENEVFGGRLFIDNNNNLVEEKKGQDKDLLPKIN